MSVPDVKEDRISLPSALTMRAITSTHAQILAFLDENPSATIEFEEEPQVDISFIQLIEAARIYASTQGKTIALSKPANGALLETLRRSGFLEGMSAEDAYFWLHQGDIQ
jgi:DNA-binding MarR family transcriptional regulator